MSNIDPDWKPFSEFSKLKSEQLNEIFSEPKLHAEKGIAAHEVFYKEHKAVGKKMGIPILIAIVISISLFCYYHPFDHYLWEALVGLIAAVIPMGLIQKYFVMSSQGRNASKEYEEHFEAFSNKMRAIRAEHVLSHFGNLSYDSVDEQKKKTIKDSGLFPRKRYDYQGEDAIYGEFEGLKVRLSDIRVIKSYKKDGKRREKTIFNGVMMVVDVNTPPDLKALLSYRKPKTFVDFDLFSWLGDQAFGTAVERKFGSQRLTGDAKFDVIFQNWSNEAGFAKETLQGDYKDFLMEFYQKYSDISFSIIDQKLYIAIPGDNICISDKTLAFDIKGDRSCLLDQDLDSTAVFEKSYSEVRYFLSVLKKVAEPFR